MLRLLLTYLAVNIYIVFDFHVDNYIFELYGYYNFNSPMC